MDQKIQAHYDGRAIIPDEPVNLESGQKLVVRIELTDQDQPPHAHLLELTRSFPDAPRDLSEQHDHYLYGTPKR